MGLPLGKEEQGCAFHTVLAFIQEQACKAGPNCRFSYPACACVALDCRDGALNPIRFMQTVFALERLVDKTIAKRFPKAPFVVSFILRLYNNVWGGMNFIDHARWTGIQPADDEEAHSD